MTRRTSTKPLLLVAASLLLVVLVWALFGQTGNFEFLRWDDPSYTYLCPFVKDGLSWANVREAFTNVVHEGIWMPVTNISYMCTISLIGPDAGAHHLVSVAIHALNAVLLLWLLVALGQRASCPLRPSGSSPLPTGATDVLPVVAAFLLSAFWALHPQRAEAVAWIASRKELLCTTFVLGGLLCWFRARKREGRGGRIALAGTYACFILACMSKPTAMCFPFLVLAVEGILRATSDNRQPSFVIRRSPFFIFHFSFFILLAAATGALAVYSQKNPEGYVGVELFSLPLWWRVLNATVAVGLYIYQMIVPIGIHLYYRAVPEGWPVDGTLGLGVLALVVVGIAGGWWWLRRRARWRTGQEAESDHSALVAMGGVILWFLASVGPTLGVFGGFGDHARADRFLYLPAMALPIAAMLLLARSMKTPSVPLSPDGALGERALPESVQVGEAASRRFTGTTGLLPVAGLAGLAVVVVMFFAIAYPVVASYRNDMTAFQHTLEADPDNWRALSHVGYAECKEGKLNEGIDKLRKGHVVLTRDAKGADLFKHAKLATVSKLAYVLMCRGKGADWDEILGVCAAIAADPACDPSGKAMEALGTAELMRRRWSDAERHLRLSINASGRNPHDYPREEAYLKLAFVLHRKGVEEYWHGQCGRREAMKYCKEAEKICLLVLNGSPHADYRQRARQYLKERLEGDPFRILPYPW